MAPGAGKRHPVTVLLHAQREDPGDGSGRRHRRHWGNHPGIGNLQQRRNPLAAPDPYSGDGLRGQVHDEGERTELVIFLTPRVIYDTNSITEATEEIKGKLRRLTKIIQE